MFDLVDHILYKTILKIKLLFIIVIKCTLMFHEHLHHLVAINDSLLNRKRITFFNKKVSIEKKKMLIC